MIVSYNAIASLGEWFYSVLSHAAEINIIPLKKGIKMAKTL